MSVEHPDFRILEPLAGSPEESSSIYRVQHRLLGPCLVKFVNLVLRAAEGRDAVEEARLMELCADPAICKVLKFSLVRDLQIHFRDLTSRPDLYTHPLVMELFQRAEAATHLVIFMPEYGGGTLSHRLVADSWDFQKRWELLLDVLAALEVVHSRGVLHLDLKPDNILFSVDGRPVLCDFGQSVALDALGVAQAPPYGYRACMPPEYYRPLPTLTMLSDVYVAAAFAYRLLNGEPFWEEAVEKASKSGDLGLAIADGLFPDQSSYHQDVPEAIRRVINQGLHPDLKRRPASAGELALALREAAGVGPCDKVARSCPYCARTDLRRAPSSFSGNPHCGGCESSRKAAFLKEPFVFGFPSEKV